MVLFALLKELKRHVRTNAIARDDPLSPFPQATCPRKGFEAGVCCAHTHHYLQRTSLGWAWGAASMLTVRVEHGDE